MAYLRNWGEVNQVLDDAQTKKFNIVRTRGDAQSNNNVFIFDTEKTLEENKQVAERLLQRVAGEIVYLVLWRTDSAKTGGQSFTIMYDTDSRQQQQAAPITIPQPQASQPTAGLYGVGANVDIDKLTADIEQRIMNRYESERLERERKQLEDDKRALQEDKNSAIGLLAQYLAPAAKQILGNLTPMPRVAGLDAQHPVRAEKIQPISKNEQGEEVQAEEEDVFTEEESDKLYDLLARFKAVEPEYMRLLEAVVKMAENGDGTYGMAKNFLLK